MFTLSHLYAYVIALVGALSFRYLSLPLPWLLGPIFACLIAAIIGIPMRAIGFVNDAMRSILGVAVGATITVSLLLTMGDMWRTLALIPIMVIVIGLIGVPYFYKLWKYDWATSYYSAMPGGLQDMLVFGEEAGGNVRSLSLIHATRVLVIVVALPFLLRNFWDARLDNLPGELAHNIPTSQLIIMVVCALVGWRVAKYFGMFGASILGPIILTTVVSLLGFLEHRPPAEAIWTAQYFIGLTVGVKYVGITVKELKRDIVAGLGYCGLLILITLVFVEAIYTLNLAPPMDALLAFAPGGQAELTVLALIVGADMAFVISHHVLRIFIVILGSPIFAKIFISKPQD